MDHNRKVVELPLDDVLPNRFQPRIKFNEDSIIELSESIKEHGVIQPIVVRPVGDKYEIIAGERRYKASVMAGLSKIPALITDLNDKDSAEVALIENVQRKDLTPIEEAISYKKILDMGYLTQEQLAEKLGKKQSTVANKLRLLNLDDDVQEAILEDKISERHARSLLKLSNPEEQKKVLKKIIEERLTVRKTDEEINKMLNGTYTDVSSTTQNKISVNLETDNNIIETAKPFDFSKLDFLQSEQKQTEPDICEIPKFEEILVDEVKIENENKTDFQVPKFDEFISNQRNSKKELEQQNFSFELPNFENFVAPINTDIAEISEEKVVSNFELPVFEEINTTLPENTEVINEELEVNGIPKFEDGLYSFPELNTNNNNSKQSTENISNLNVLSDNLMNNTDKIVEKPTPFVFDDLFISEENLQILNNSDSLDLVEIPENINFIDEIEVANIVEEIPKVISCSNMYVANDFKTAINTIRNCAQTIEKYGFKISVEELELANEYKVNFTITK